MNLARITKIIVFESSEENRYMFASDSLIDSRYKAEYLLGVRLTTVDKFRRNINLSKLLILQHVSEF